MNTNSLDDLARAEADVQATRKRVALSVVALREEVSRQVDWRWRVAKRPAAYLCAAFVVGFWFGSRR